jgi:hypothetical protein
MYSVCHSGQALIGLKSTCWLKWFELVRIDKLIVRLLSRRPICVS